MKLDILVVAAHPDDAEMSCGGTIALEVQRGKKVGIIDLTRGELSTRGTPETRHGEATAASKILGLSIRENLGFRDGFFQNDETHQLALVKIIRKYQPDVLIANAPDDRHPDHGKAAQLTEVACFLSGLRRITTTEAGQQQAPWRPSQVYHYIQDRYIKPDFVVDITPTIETKIASVRAFKSQFYDPQNSEPGSYISSKSFFEFLIARWREMGHSIGVEFGEGFVSRRILGVDSLDALK